MRQDCLKHLSLLPLDSQGRKRTLLAVEESQGRMEMILERPWPSGSER